MLYYCTIQHFAEGGRKRAQRGPIAGNGRGETRFVNNLLLAVCCDGGGMQPTADEIEHEKEALRDIRRRSVAQVAELDPDLPSTSATSSSSSLNEDGKPVVDTSDPSHLFWVPAHVHPELAPGEFKAFIKDHASIQRALSHRSQGGMSRRRSVLSQQLRPGASDDGEDEQAEQPVVQPRRRGTRRENMSTLTLEELQEIEDLAEQANNDPNELRNILRRSLSLTASSQGQPLFEFPLNVVLTRFLKNPKILMHPSSPICLAI
jgi:hypothetical protein